MDCATNTHSLTVVIPCLNDEGHLKALIPQLQQQSKIQLQIIVADGGSTDSTEQFCHTHNIQMNRTLPGRGHQMNQAIPLARHPYLLFLHCDTALPHNLLLFDAMEALLIPPMQNKAGHFSIQFQRAKTNKHSFAFRYMEEKTKTNRPDTINGDQGLLISKNFFSSLGGFDESLHFLEDQKISHKIFENGQWILLPGYLVTSARRFEKEGHHRLYILMGIMMGLYKCGVSPFFKKAPELYRSQSYTDKLLLTPFFIYIWKMNIYELGFFGSIAAWYKVGRYIRSQTWQMFYFFDQLLRPIYRRPVFPLLWFSDHIFYPLTSNPLSNVIVMLISHLWLMWILFPFYFLKDHLLQKHLLNSRG